VTENTIKALRAFDDWRRDNYADDSPRRPRWVELADRLNASERATALACVDAMTEARHVAIREIELSCEEVEMPLERVEDLLAPWITFLVVPLFALANAGVRIGGAGELFGSPVALGIFLGLVLGKPIGVLLAAQLALRSRIGVLPEGISMGQFAGVAVLTGIGFTMSLFVAELAFGESPSLAIAKLTTLAASVLMGVAGFLLLRFGRAQAA
jgi:NhaA family Na+:H+ antiporter